MAVWLIRVGKNGEDENAALDKSLAIVGWTEMPDSSDITSYKKIWVVVPEED